MAQIGESLAKLTERDLRLDRFGRVVILNPDVEREIKEAARLESTGEELAGNGICCGNGSCASPELVSLFQRLVGGRAAAALGG
jgi:hypothetical protein